MMLDFGLFAWKECFESAPVDKTPVFWVGHFSGERLLGSLWAADPSDEVAMTLACASPFGVSDPSDTFVVRMREPHLLVAHMHHNGRGVRTAQYQVTYSIADRGALVLGIATVTPNTDRVDDALRVLSDRRLADGKVWDFESSFHAAAKWGYLHERL